MNYVWKDAIKLRHNMKFDEMVLAVEYARWCGFHSESATFPVTSFENGLEIPKAFSEFSCENKETKQQILPKDYVAASDYAKPMPDFDFRTERGLETLFSTGEVLKDMDLDRLPDTMDVHFVMEEDSEDLLEAACNMAFRLGMETTSYKGVLLVKEERKGNVIRFSKGKTTGMSLESQKPLQINVHGSGEELVTFVAKVCEEFPLQGGFDTWIDTMTEMAEGFQMKTLDGQLAALRANDVQEMGSALAYVNPEVEERREELEKEFPSVSFVDYKKDCLVYKKEYEFPWEVDVFNEIMKTRVYNKLNRGDVVEIYSALSEDKIVRKELFGNVKAQMEEKGATIKEAQIICAYKQGFSYIEEQVLTRLKGKKVSKFEIAFQPFIPEGQKEWVDEDGATPTYNNGDKGESYWYDMPIRFLQELYPIEDVIVKELQISGDQVVFVPYEGEEDITYLIRALDEEENTILEDSYKVRYKERFYLDEYPTMGKVHPTTGYLKVLVNGEILVDEEIKTDIDYIWDTYQGQVLPQVRTYVDEKTGGSNLISQQPFFSTLKLDVSASEPNEKLDSREDMFSTLEALHQDMYFVGTDYFKCYGQKKEGALTDAPGLILPCIHKAKGAPTMEVELFRQESDEPALFIREKRIVNTLKKEDIQIYVGEICQEQNKIIVKIKVKGVPKNYVKAYAQLLDLKVLDIANRIYFADELWFEVDEFLFKAQVNKATATKKDLSIEDVKVPEDELIGYHEYLKLIQQLKRVKGIKVYRTTRSYKGREHYAVEFDPGHQGYTSRTKRSVHYPTELIMCRHHANEVSSTNEAFMLIKKLLTKEEYKQLTDKMNLTIVPMDNVDGAAIHYELQKENPNWKLHVARFNAVGKEFYHDHFVKETIHTEAIGLRRLFMTLLPDALIDNHGVPSHEWDQPYSGYTAPSFRGFWLPRSLLYGYFFHITGEEYKSNIAMNKVTEEVIANTYLNSEEVTRENLMWARQFEKYAHKWMPKMFPATYYKNMINYWIPHEYDDSHRYPSIRFPWILGLDYVSEVADETAQGAYLNQCARAHLMHDEAIIHMIERAQKVYETKYELQDDICVTCKRKRPLIVSVEE
ncbi:MAG: hypothetical protein K6A30_08250 [Lachnospiraceae bacterium]|nr:hypothetical protein [Lachnospiraceae bacterium]